MLLLIQLGYHLLPHSLLPILHHIPLMNRILLIIFCFCRSTTQGMNYLAALAAMGGLAVLSMWWHLEWPPGWILCLGWVDLSWQMSPTHAENALPLQKIRGGSEAFLATKRNLL
jgi:hypothetical protein